MPLPLSLIGHLGIGDQPYPGPFVPPIAPDAPTGLRPVTVDSVWLDAGGAAITVRMTMVLAASVSVNPRTTAGQVEYVCVDGTTVTVEYLSAADSLGAPLAHIPDGGQFFGRALGGDYTVDGRPILEVSAFSWNSASLQGLNLRFMSFVGGPTNLTFTGPLLCTIPAPVVISEVRSAVGPVMDLGDGYVGVNTGYNTIVDPRRLPSGTSALSTFVQLWRLTPESVTYVDTFQTEVPINDAARFHGLRTIYQGHANLAPNRVVAVGADFLGGSFGNVIERVGEVVTFGPSFSVVADSTAPGTTYPEDWYLSPRIYSSVSAPWLRDPELAAWEQNHGVLTGEYLCVSGSSTSFVVAASLQCFDPEHNATIVTRRYSVSGLTVTPTMGWAFNPDIRPVFVVDSFGGSARLTGQASAGANGYVSAWNGDKQSVHRIDLSTGQIVVGEQTFLAYTMAGGGWRPGPTTAVPGSLMITSQGGPTLEQIEVQTLDLVTLAIKSSYAVSWPAPGFVRVWLDVAGSYPMEVLHQIPRVAFQRTLSWVFWGGPTQKFIGMFSGTELTTEVVQNPDSYTTGGVAVVADSYLIAIPTFSLGWTPVHTSVSPSDRPPFGVYYRSPLPVLGIERRSGSATFLP